MNATARIQMTLALYFRADDGSRRGCSSQMSASVFQFVVDKLFNVLEVQFWAVSYPGNTYSYFFKFLYEFYLQKQIHVRKKNQN